MTHGEKAMKVYRLMGLFLALPIGLALVALPGCGGGDKKDGGEVKSDGGGGGGGKGKPLSGDRGAGMAGKSGPKEELASTGTGTLKGRVVFEGTPPEVKKD